MKYNLTEEQINRIHEECSKMVEIRCSECIHKEKCPDLNNFRTGCIFEDKELYLNKFGL